jgi:hypothetical protein
MESIKTFADDNAKKDMILAVLKESFHMIPREDYLVMVDLVFTKLASMQKYRKKMLEKDEEALRDVAESYGVDVDAVLDSYLYFLLIVESVYLQRELFKSLNREDE